jgi:hypothetical protein
MKFNPDKHYLGTLCKRGHEWEKSGKSLRYKSIRTCFQCNQIKNKKQVENKYFKKYYIENKKKLSNQQKKNRKKNKHKIAEFQHEYYQKNRTKLDSSSRQWAKNNPQKRKIINRKSYHKKYHWKQILKRSPQFKEIIEAWTNYKIAILNLQKSLRKELL